MSPKKISLSSLVRCLDCGAVFTQDLETCPECGAVSPHRPPMEGGGRKWTPRTA